ncbi:porin [Lysobacter sp. CA199]|uniref:porin n=1 Tax=Lysobacter sp. CA199 TaxID=3455608 RepID=UPI003F8CFF2E
MKRALLALTLAAALPLSASAAEGISYNYVEAGYAKTDGKYSSGDADGWAIAGSYAFLPNFHAFAGYSKQETDSRNFGGFRVPSTDLDTWNVGVGYNHELSKRVDLVTRIAYEQRKFDNSLFGSDKLKGGNVEVGVRGSLAPNWEGYAFAGYQDYDQHYDGKAYGRIGTQVKFNQSWGITADAKFIDGGEKEFFIGPRFSF